MIDPLAGSGLVVVDKPGGLTSHDVVSQVRRLAGTRKVGHAGTLDPMATGVLLVGVNRATRLLGHLTLADKEYDAVVRLGATTTTDDAEGQALSTMSTTHLAEADVLAEVSHFTGELEQVPPSVSAVKVDGQRSYRRVRAGEDPELPARAVHVHHLAVQGITRSDQRLDVALSVRCSSGTYVRAIARDLGAALGVGGHLAALRRTQVGGISLREATPLAVMEETGVVPLVPMAEVARRFFPTVTLDARATQDVGFGRPLEVELPRGQTTAVLAPDGSFLALYRGGDGEEATEAARPVAVFV